MNAAASDRTNPDLRAHQCCRECGPDSTTRWCPQFRCLRNQGRGHDEWSYVSNQCANTDCRMPLCDDHLHLADTRLRFCSECHKARAHCTTCGIGGIDAYSYTNQETAGKGRYVAKDLSLWPCNPALGCFDYLCSLHQRLNAAISGGCGRHKGGATSVRTEPIVGTEPEPQPEPVKRSCRPRPNRKTKPEPEGGTGAEAGTRRPVLTFTRT